VIRDGDVTQQQSPGFSPQLFKEKGKKNLPDTVKMFNI
jgi:hypothetical protein